MNNRVTTESKNILKYYCDHITSTTPPNAKLYARNPKLHLVLSIVIESNFSYFEFCLYLLFLLLIFVIYFAYLKSLKSPHVILDSI